MLMILKYIKARYINCYLDEKAQGMVEYAMLIACVISIAVYLFYGNGEDQAIRHTIEGANETLEASSRNSAGS